VKVGKIYNGRVVSIKDFGAFVEIAPETDGLCHVSELSDNYVDRVTDVVNIGDEVRVKVILVDDQGRIKLSRKAAMREEGLSDPAPPGEAAVEAVQAVKAAAADPAATHPATETNPTRQRSRALQSALGRFVSRPPRLAAPLAGRSFQSCSGTGRFFQRAPCRRS